MSTPGVAVRAAVIAGTLVRIGRMLFGPAAAAAVSIALGEVVSHVAGHGLAPWVALALAGTFGLWMSAELHAVPSPPPRADDDEGY